MTDSKKEIEETMVATAWEMVCNKEYAKASEVLAGLSRLMSDEKLTKACTLSDLRKVDVSSFDYTDQDMRDHHLILEKVNGKKRTRYYLINRDLMNVTEKAYGVRDFIGYIDFSCKHNTLKFIAKSICIEENGAIFAPSWALPNCYFDNHDYGNSSRNTVREVK